MVKINVNDKGECHVYVRGDWDKVRNHLLVAATKVRTMAADTRKFSKAASGVTPLSDLKKKVEEPKQDADTNGQSLQPRPLINRGFEMQFPQVDRPARQPQINRPPQVNRPAGGAA